MELTQEHIEFLDDHVSKMGLMFIVDRVEARFKLNKSDAIAVVDAYEASRPNPQAKAELEKMGKAVADVLVRAICPDHPAVPERLKRFPMFKGRYLIHYTVFVGPDGQPDFKVVHSENRRNALAKNLCHLCGQKMAPPYAFIGGPLCVRGRLFMDGPMHEECARYAAKVCPYLNSPDGGHSKAPPKHEGMDCGDGKIIVTQTDESVAAGRPDRIAICLTESYREVMYRGSVYIQAGPWIAVDWDAMPQRTPGGGCPHGHGNGDG